MQPSLVSDVHAKDIGHERWGKTGMILTMIKPVIMAFLLMAIVYFIIFLRTNKKDTRYYQETGKTEWNVFFDSGKHGKFKTSEALAKLLPESRTILNAYLPTNKGTSETDIIFICEYGIYVVENKNYNGWIFGDENSKN